MRKFSIYGHLGTWAKNDKGEWYRLEENFRWDDLSKPFYPPYSKDPMEFVGFNDTFFKATIRFQGKEKIIYFGDEHLNTIGSTNVYPPTQKDVNYYLTIEEKIVDPISLPNMVLSVKEVGKFAGSYAPKDYNTNSEVEIIEGKPVKLPGSQMTLEIFDIQKDSVTFRMGYRVDISKMYIVKKGEPVVYCDKGSSGRYEDFEGHDIEITIELTEK